MLNGDDVSLRARLMTFRPPYYMDIVSLVDYPPVLYQSQHIKYFWQDSAGPVIYLSTQPTLANPICLYYGHHCCWCLCIRINNGIRCDVEVLSIHDLCCLKQDRMMRIDLERLLLLFWSMVENIA